MKRERTLYRAILFLLFSFVTLSGFGEEMELQQTLSRLSAKLSWDPLLKTGMLLTEKHRISFTILVEDQTAPFIIDNQYVLYLPAPRYNNGTLYFPSETIAGLEQALRTITTNEQSLYRIAAIVIDPGQDDRTGLLRPELELNVGICGDGRLEVGRKHLLAVHSAGELVDDLAGDHLAAGILALPGLHDV